MLKFTYNLLITFILWIYFTIGFVIFFAPFYVISYFFSKNRETSFQRLNHIFYKSFFWLLKTLSLQLKIEISDKLYNIKSCVVVCNHLSYLDPILLISILKKQKTIIKNIFFKVPIFGQVLKTSGYIPAASKSFFMMQEINQINNLKNYFLDNGNVFIFPEGTRTKNGKIGNFKKGAFKLAKKHKLTIAVVYIQNTNKILTPGKFLINAYDKNTIKVDLIDCVSPNYEDKNFSLIKLIEQIKNLYVDI